MRLLQVNCQPLPAPWTGLSSNLPGVFPGHGVEAQIFLLPDGPYTAWV